MIVEIKTRSLDGVEVSRVERKLYTLAELKEGKHIEGEDIVEHRRASAFDEACNNITRMMDESGWTSDSVEADIDNYLLPDVLGKAGITTDDGSKSISWDVSPTQSGRFFSLDPAHTKVDAAQFLRAMQMWFAGRDWRGQEYKASTQQPRFPVPNQQKRLDLRSSDAWHARQDGVYVQLAHRSMWSSELEIEPGYNYEHEFSDEFITDCNDFLEEVLRFCFTTIRDTYEGEFEEESVLGAAEANEWTFTDEGKWA